MTETQKKLTIIGAVIIIALLLLFNKKQNNATATNKTEMPTINVDIPGFSLPPRTPIAINIPGLPSGSTYEFQAISPCMCNGQSISNANSGSGLTFVVNEGSAGPSIYNYANVISAGSGGTYMRAWSCYGRSGYTTYASDGTIISNPSPC